VSYGLALYGVDRVVGRAVRTAAAALMTVALVTPAVRASWTVVNLHPSWWDHSYGYGVAGGQQVGVVAEYPFTGTHAALWSGSAGSFVDLHPSEWYLSSAAYGVGDGQQVGSALLDIYYRARRAVERVCQLVRRPASQRVVPVVGLRRGGRSAGGVRVS